MIFTREWFFDLDKKLRAMGLDSDAQSFDEILKNLRERKIYDADSFASHCAYVILAGGFSQRTAKKIHEKIMSVLRNNLPRPLRVHPSVYGTGVLTEDGNNPPRRFAPPLPGGAYAPPLEGNLSSLGGAGVKFSSVGGVPRRGEVGIKKSDINFNLPQNKSLLNRAKSLRKAGSLPEALLWNELKSKQINGLDFDRQKVIGNYIVDFYCAGLGVVLEIDDKSHDMKDLYDEKRECYLTSLGLRVIHIAAKDVLNNPGNVADMLKLNLQTAKSNLFDALIKIFNNKNKINAICKIWENRTALRDGYYALDVLDDKLNYLQKLPHIGKITANHLARNLGEDIVKYDIWIQRLGVAYATQSANNKMQRANLKAKINNGALSDEIKCACDDMFAHLVQQTGLPRGYIDVVLWKSLQQKLISMDDCLHKPSVM